MEIVRDQLQHCTIDEFLKFYPHNLTMDSEYLHKLVKLIRVAHRETENWSIEEVVSTCLYNYGGTVVEALVDALWNS